MFTSRYAITFGEMFYTHDGLTEQQDKKQYSFSVQNLQMIKNRLLEHNPPIESEIISLDQILPEELKQQNKASVLVIPKMANLMMQDNHGADLLYEQQQGVNYDKKYYDKVMKKTFNRRARYHIIFGDNARQASQDYQQYTIKSFEQLKYLNLIRNKLGEFFYVNQHLSSNYLSKYYAEGVQYFDQNSGLGFHGDDGRKVVIGLCLGKTATLRYCWRKPHSSANNYLPPIDVKLNHGDIYIMSEKATGNDWKKRNKIRVVHAAGAQKYVKI